MYDIHRPYQGENDDDENTVAQCRIIPVEHGDGLYVALGLWRDRVPQNMAGFALLGQNSCALHNWLLVDRRKESLREVPP